MERVQAIGRGQTMLRVAGVLSVLGLVVGCKSTPSQQSQVLASAVTTVAAPDDPVVADVDTDRLRWSQVQTRLAEMKGQEHAEVRAAALAASDLLVVREMRVLGLAPQPTETTGQAADRFLRLTWDGSRGCALTEAEVRLAYMQNLAKYKHPPSWTVWDAFALCCEVESGCPIVETEACRARLRPQLQALHGEINNTFKTLPAISQPGPGAEVTLDQSPLKAQHLPAVEEAVARLQAREPKIRLLRYTFWQAGVPGFEKAPFRHGDPAIERALLQAPLGAVLGPIEGEDADHVVVLAAAAPLSLGLPKTPTATDVDPVALELRKQLCGETAVQERTAYRERLLSGARLVWHKDKLAGRLQKASVDQLEATARQP